jgi:hypothetical protein
MCAVAIIFLGLLEEIIPKILLNLPVAAGAAVSIFYRAAGDIPQPFRRRLHFFRVARIASAIISFLRVAVKEKKILTAAEYVV